jgi:hypothetical protein
VAPPETAPVVPTAVSDDLESAQAATPRTAMLTVEAATPFRNWRREIDLLIRKFSFHVKKIKK